jgi:hypothetical protein
MKRKQSTSIHPVLRAQLRAKWVAESVNAQIHALYGDNKDKLLAYGSVLMFVASACAAQRDTGENSPQFRIIRGAINALDDLKDLNNVLLKSGLVNGKIVAKNGASTSAVYSGISKE